MASQQRAVSPAPCVPLLHVCWGEGAEPGQSSAKGVSGPWINERGKGRKSLQHRGASSAKDWRPCVFLGKCRWFETDGLQVREMDRKPKDHPRR